MYTTLLFDESPYIALTFGFLLILFYKFNNTLCVITFLIFLLIMVFYRYIPYNNRVDDYRIISPAEGVILDMVQVGNNVLIAIYLNIFNTHTQIYPVNGTVKSRYYDETGKFALIINKEKSKDNEKKIHTIQMNNGNIVIVTQIAGLLPRRISSDDRIDCNVSAGEYLGIIKFGSRVDILFPGYISNVKLNIGDKINIGDPIYTY